MGNDIEQENTKTVKNEDGTVTMTLDYPITETVRRGQETITNVVNEVKFRRINAGDLKAVANLKQEGDRMEVLFIRTTGLAAPTFSKLDAVDLVDGMAVIEGFLPPSLLASLGETTNGQNT